MVEYIVYGLLAAVLGMAFALSKTKQRVDKVYRKMRQINARFEALEKAAGLEQTKTDIGIEAL